MSDTADLQLDVARVWLLEPNGTPTGESRWDRKLRLDGNAETAHRITPVVWLRLADGERGLWPWIAEHVHRNPMHLSQVIRPLAVEMWTNDLERGWMHHRLPRIEVHDTGDKVPEDADWWPSWQWLGRVNRNWREPEFRETPLAWAQVQERPAGAPPPVPRRELVTL